MRDCDAAALRLVPLMCQLCRPKGRDDPSQLVGGDARIKAMIAELQESIDFQFVTYLGSAAITDEPRLRYIGSLSLTSPTNSPLGCSLNNSASERGAKDHSLRELHPRAVVVIAALITGAVFAVENFGHQSTQAQNDA